MIDANEAWTAYHREPSHEHRNRLIEHYLPIVHRTANWLWERKPKGAALDELVSAGVFGLMDAIKSFDVERGVKFETYCVRRVRGAMLDGLRQQGWQPRSVHQRASQIRSARQQLAIELLRRPSEAEIADHLQIAFSEFTRATTGLISTGMTELQLETLRDSKGADPPRQMQRKDLRDLVTQHLKPRERLIVTLYYWESLSMREIGVVVGITESRVSQMLTGILSRLRVRLKRRENEFY